MLLFDQLSTHEKKVQELNGPFIDLTMNYEFYINIAK